MKKIFLVLACFIFLAGRSATKNPAMNAVNHSEKTVLVKLSEEEKIKKLIEFIKNLKGATFIRNGSGHTPEEAAKHLELKRKNAGDKVKTAVQFIVVCGSKSSTTGKEYFIKLADGKTIKSIDLLVGELKKIEATNK